MAKHILGTLKRSYKKPKQEEIKLFIAPKSVCAIKSRNRAVISALKDVPFSISTSFAFYANQVGASERDMKIKLKLIETVFPVVTRIEALIFSYFSFKDFQMK